MPKTKKDSWKVIVQIDRADWESMEELFRVALGHSDGSGIGLGGRDLEWYADSEKQAVAKARKAKRVVGNRKKITVEVSCCDEDSDESYFV